MRLNAHEARIVLWLVSERLRSDRHCPLSVAALARRLDSEIRYGLSPTRHDDSETDSNTTRLSHGGSQEFMGTGLAAATLGRNERWVQRHAAELGGTQIGGTRGRYIFNAAAVRAYADQLKG